MEKKYVRRYQTLFIKDRAIYEEIKNTLPEGMKLAHYIEIIVKLGLEEHKKVKA